MAIAGCSQDELESILHQIIRESKDAEKIARQNLLNIKESDSSSSEEEPEHHASNQDGVVRKCKHCDEEYNKDDNSEDACSWHNGNQDHLAASRLRRRSTLTT